MALTRDQTVALARSQIGTRESPFGSNRVLYSFWYGFIAAWCAMFVSWVCWKAGIGWYRFASTAVSVSAARRDGRLVPVSQALPGDVMVHLYSSTLGHTGIATSNGGRSTVEGNTDGGGSRTGGQVMEHQRPADYWHYCIRLDYPSAPSRPEVLPMFGPFDIHAAVASAKDPVTGGVWLLGQDGAVFAFEGARGVRGVNGQSFFAGRQAAQIERDGNGFAVAPAGKILTVIASSGERYDLPF